MSKRPVSKRLQRSVQSEAQTALERAVGRARLALLWERTWPPLVGVGVVLAAFLVLSWGGLWMAVPNLARILGIALFAALLIYALHPFLALRWPSREDALARLDRLSPLGHRPATAIGDSLATRPDDPVGAALWRAHLARALDAARTLRAGLPKPDLARRDPYAIRALALIALVPAFFIATGEHRARVAAAFNWHALTEPAPYRLDAWVDPPAYTGRPPVVLQGLRSDDTTTLNASAFEVPAGSVLVVRATGIDTTALHVAGAIAEAKPDGEGKATAAASSDERRFTIAGDADVSFTGADDRRVMWHFKALPDRAPSIDFAKDPATGLRNALVLAYRMDDDYGVKQADAVFTALPPEPSFFPRPGSKPPAPPEHPLVPPPDFKLSLPTGGRSGAAQTTHDLVAHPWAGAKVNLTLVAHDEAGQEGRSETRQIRLPARTFTKPIARALIDERRRLAFDASNRRRLVTVLTALTDAPEQFTPDAGEYLGLRTALARAKNARNDDDLRALVDYLWEVATLIEDGTLSEAERELKAAQEALREALERGASDDEIKRLTSELRAAMNKMMRQLAEQAQRSPSDDRPLDPNTRIVRQQDLERMLNRIEDLARSGNREAAQQLLNELQAMMENLKPGNRQAGQQQGRQQNELGAMIQEQQRLRDRTYRQGQQQGQQQQGQRGQRGQKGNPQQGQNGDFSELQQGQQELRQRLGRTLDALRRMQRGQDGEQGQKGEGQAGQGEGSDPMGRAGDALGRAEQAMREAEDALGKGDGQGALDSEGKALQALRQGAQAMAEAQQQGAPNGFGPGGPSGESAERTDPLGRPLRSQDYGDDFTVKVPDEIDAQRARRVLEELRRRLEQPERPQMELDYLERLLQGL